MTVLSAGVHSPYAKYKTDPDLENNFSIKNGADSAGFYNDIAIDQLSKEHPTVSFFHTAPGFVGSAWGSELAWYLKGPIRLLQATLATSVQVRERGEEGRERVLLVGDIHIQWNVSFPLITTITLLLSLLPQNISLMHHDYICILLCPACLAHTASHCLPAGLPACLLGLRGVPLPLSGERGVCWGRSLLHGPPGREDGQDGAARGGGGRGVGAHARGDQESHRSSCGGS
jgi:hypothetical protein